MAGDDGEIVAGREGRQLTGVVGNDSVLTRALRVGGWIGKFVEE